MAAPFTTTTQLEQPVNVMFQRQLLMNARPNCPYFSGTEAAVIQEHQGTFTAYWRRIENLAPVTTPLTALTGNLAVPVRDSVQPTATNITRTLAKYGLYILLQEEVDLINFNGQTAKLVEVLGINAGRSLNQLQRNEEEDNSTAILANGVGSVGAIDKAIAAGDINKAINEIERQDGLPFTPLTTGALQIGTTPIHSAYLGICHPDVRIDIEGLSGFIKVEQYAGQVQTYQGEFGMFSRVRFLTTTDSTIDAGAGALIGATGLRGGANVDVYNTVIFGMQAFGSVGLQTAHLKSIYLAGDDQPGIKMIHKPRGSAGALDPLNEYETLGWKSWHVGSVLNGNWSRNVKSGATAL